MSFIELVLRYPSKVIGMARLGATPKDRLAIVILHLWFTALWRLGRSPSLREPKRIKIRVFQSMVSIAIKHAIDLAVYREIFHDKHYALPLDFEPRVIFDLGANIGASVLYFALRFPSAQIFAFEPDPENIEMFKLNLGQYNFMDRVTLIEKAVWGSDGETLLLHLIRDQHYSSSVVERSGATRSIKVTSTTIDHVMKSYDIHSIDLLKFDIEGAEGIVFAAFSNIARVRFLVGEVHPDITGLSVESFIAGLNGFRLVWSMDNRVLLENVRW